MATLSEVLGALSNPKSGITQASRTNWRLTGVQNAGELIGIMVGSPIPFPMALYDPFINEFVRWSPIGAISSIGLPRGGWKTLPVHEPELINFPQFLAERFGHRAYDDLPNIHFDPVDQPDAAILWDLIDGLDDLDTLQEEFDFISWSVVGFLANPGLEVWMLECMSDSEGYVQVLKEDDWLYIESTSELYKGRQNLEPVQDHSAIAKALGWRHIDAIPNDFVLLRNDSSAGQALSMLALHSISALHRLIRARRIIASVADSSGTKPKMVSTLRRRTKRTR